MSKQSELLDIIRIKQRESGLPQHEFAKKLGISKMMLWLVFNERRDMGRKFLSGIINCYPELQPEVLQYLRRG